MTIGRITRIALLIPAAILLFAVIVRSGARRAAAAPLPESADRRCTPVGGALMTNIGTIADLTNLGPAFGDLQGSLAATLLGQNNNGTFNVQHYWVTSAGDTITFKVAVLTPTFPTSNKAIVSVPWGNYRSEITGGTGKFDHATGYLDYFGMADFQQNTIVLRYRGQVCFASPDSD